MSRVLYAGPEVYAIMGSAMRVHRELGSGFLEAVYYLKVTRQKVGLLINFGSGAKLEWRRFVF